MYPPSYQKCPSSFNLTLLLPPCAKYPPVPLPKPFWETQRKRRETLPAPKKCLFLAPEKSSSPYSNFHVITQYKLHL